MKGKKILVIEPDFESLKFLSKFLLDAKFELIFAYDGEEGLRKAKTENPDLVILEPRLPKMNGFDLCSIITKDFEKKIPVIILTEFFKDLKAEILHSFGAAAYLNKPFEKEKLFYTILDLLKVEKRGKTGEEMKKANPDTESLPERCQEKSELVPKKMRSNSGNESGNNGEGNNGNGTNGNGSHGRNRRKQLENLISSFMLNTGHNLMPSPTHNGNGSQKKNRQESHHAIKIDDMLENVLSEFGLTSKKKTSLEEDIHALDDLIASS